MIKPAFLLVGFGYSRYLPPFSRLIKYLFFFRRITITPLYAGMNFNAPN
jgi:hypothetical protein